MRPDDVCALCDRAITSNQQLHLYVGKGWCHGGAREYIPTHWHCLVIDQGDGHGYPTDSPMGDVVRDYIRQRIAPVSR